MFHLSPIRLPAVIGLSLGLLASSTSPTHAAWLEGRVVGIADGDTITILTADRRQHRIRLTGIDAPEKGQAFSDASRHHLASLVSGKNVRIEWQKKDQYKRYVGKVYVGNLDVCLAQLVAGYAWHFKRYEKEQSVADRERYAQAERLAREERRGLWQDKRPMPPWEWRRSRART